MRMRFLGQPFDEFGQIADVLKEQLMGGSDRKLWVATAWAKRSGLARLENALAHFREQGGSSVAIIGIDEGGATKQGLRLAMEVFDQTNVFHDHSRRTFHPKVYLIENGEEACLIAGSSNATAGGLYDNYEASIVGILDLSTREDRELFESVSGWFRSLLDDAACVRLDADVINRLIEDGRYRIGDEDNPERGSPQFGGYRDGVSTDSPSQSIFEASSTPKRPLSTLQGELRRGRRTERTRGTGPREPVQERRKLKWFKKMSRADSQQPAGAKTNPTGNLKLTKAGQNIDRESFFRDQLFGDADWTSETREAGELEKATVSIEVYVEDESFGKLDFKVDHGLFRIANQNNVPTWLHWGVFGSVLRENDHRGKWVIIESFYDGSYRLRITDENPE